MRPEQRVAIAFELSDEVRAISLAGIQARHPDLDDAAALRELARMLHPELRTR
jgi:hypothetical protein